MKKILFIAALFGMGLTISSCDLEKYPDTGYNENNTTITDDSESSISTREDLQGQLTSMYEYMKGDMQTYWYQLITLAEARADNAYGGNKGEAKVVAMEANKMDSDNEFASNLWNYSMNAVDKANQIICNIDQVKQNDATLTDNEYKQWLSEALCFRAFIWINMMQLFGEIPMLTEIPPSINADNVDEVYPLYFPKRVPQQEVGAQIVKDIEEYACLNAPDADPSNKFQLSKGFAYGLMARFYSLRPFRNWGKVITACQAVESMNYTLCSNYGDLWAYSTGDTGVAVQNAQESIFEIQWPSRTSGSWFWMMFHRNAYNPSDSFSWAKWCTPSRNLTNAYTALGDSERLNASVAYDECGWSFHYAKDNYAFMHKIPTNMSSLYIMRLAEVKLLHAEALANTNDANGAADLVDEIRGRAKVKTLVSTAERASAETMRKVVLAERRLELAFEGYRWFDLMRYGDNYTLLKEISDGVNIKGAASYDSYYEVRRVMDDNHVILPIPNQTIEKNPNLEQNLGY